VGYAATTFDIRVCLGTAYPTCSTAMMNSRDNLLLGYSDPTYNFGTIPGAYYPSSGTAFSVSRDSNLYYKISNDGCPSTGFVGERCLIHNSLLSPHLLWLPKAISTISTSPCRQRVQRL
jgi:hypothetical protein